MQYKRQAVRFIFDWQKSKDSKRHDHVWVQEYLTRVMNPQEVPYPWQGIMIGELQIVMRVKNEGLRSEGGYTQLLKYTRVLVKLLQWQQ